MDTNNVKKRSNVSATNPELHRSICSKGGIAAHASGKAHKFTSAEAADAGAKGGGKVYASRGREYMRELGRKGGQARRAKQLQKQLDQQNRTEDTCFVSAITGGDTTFNEEDSGYGGPIGL